MPFFNQIASYINDQLRAGSLNKKKLQPANYLGISTIVGRKKNAAQKDLEQLPAIVASNGKATVITPDDKYAIQIYHKLLTNVYSYEKKSYGDDHDIKSSTEVSMVVIANSKLTGVTTDVLEPVVLFGMPQHLSDALMAELKLNKCLITPIASNMDAISVFKQEFPQSAHFLNTQMSMFLIRYKIEMTFSQSCVEKCLCE